MKMIDFMAMEIVEVDSFEPIDCYLELDALLDEPYTKFMESLKGHMNNIAVIISDNQYVDEPWLIKIHTDLNDDDLAMVRENIVCEFGNAIVNYKKLKREERRLGLPEELKEVDMLYLTAMDLVNFETVIDVFNIYIYNDKDEFYDDLLRKEVE